jgi:hypothetical protein
MKNPIPNSVRGIIIGTWIAGLVWLENRRALRAVHTSMLRRLGPQGGVKQIPNAKSARPVRIHLFWRDGVMDAVEARRNYDARYSPLQSEWQAYVRMMEENAEK